MNQAFSKIWIAVILVIFVIGGILVWQYFLVSKEEVSPPKGKIVEKKITVLPPLKVTIYTDGFAKIEIKVALSDNTGYQGGVKKPVFAAENEIITYEVYRSIEPETDFVKIATKTVEPGCKYFAVFDKDYPKTAKIFQYKYKRISSFGGIVESEITKAEILQAVSVGHQPWRAEPLWVAESEGSGYYGFRKPCAGWGESGGQPRNDCDVYNLIQQSGEVVEVRVIHDDQIFIIEVRRPLFDVDWWSVSEIREISQG